MHRLATDPVIDAFERIRRRPYAFLLETASGGPVFMGSDPVEVLELTGGDPFGELEKFLARHGHAVGWFGYDLGRHLEKLPGRAKDDLDFPELCVAAYRKIERLEATAPSPAPPPGGGEVRCTFTKPEYLDAIRRAKEYIAAGDVYQVNLSQRFDVAGDAPFDAYRRLRETSPAPYSAYFDFGGRALISSSPEQFLEIRGRRVVTRPIKGTRPLGRETELLESAKDDAELAMIVDLERNDLGRVCEYGTVEVEAAKILETHPTLHHLSARVAGRLRDGVGPVDVLRATFPGGSVTGAPKIRAMEIIDELEPTRRGVYTGAIGHIGLDGGTNLAVAIRVIHWRAGRFSFQVGGAIVADSDPEEEYQETLVKAAGIARALGIEWNISR